MDGDARIGDVLEAQLVVELREEVDGTERHERGAEYAPALSAAANAGNSAGWTGRRLLARIERRRPEDRRAAAASVAPAWAVSSVAGAAARLASKRPRTASRAVRARVPARGGDPVRLHVLVLTFRWRGDSSMDEQRLGRTRPGKPRPRARLGKSRAHQVHAHQAGYRPRREVSSPRAPGATLAEPCVHRRVETLSYGSFMLLQVRTRFSG